MTKPVGGGGAGVSPALEARELEVPFGGSPGLRGISFRVETGERFALVGASGAGKSSLLRALSGTGPLSAGRVLVEGRDVTLLPPEKRGVVLLAQRPLLFPHLSVFENVAFPLRVRGVPRAEIPIRVEEALSAVRLEAFGSRTPRSLSGGQAHRVALARAVVAQPAVLLLDEPLTSLDPALRDEVRRSILAVHREYGPAVVMVTHDLEEAGKVADRVGVVLNGRLAQVAPPGLLFREPASADVARFLGLPNELRGRLGVDGELFVAGWSSVLAGFGTRGLPAASPAAGGGLGCRGTAVLVIFGVDAGLVVPAGSGGLDARLEQIHHHPQGATARVCFLPGREDPVAGGGSREVLSCEVSVDPVCSPEPGSRVEVTFRPDLMHLFEANEP